MEDAVLGFFASDGWELTPAGDGHTWGAAVAGEQAAWTTMIQVYEGPGVYAFYSLVPVEVPEERLAAVVDFLSRANAGMVTGNFEVDFTDSSVRFKTALDMSALPEAIQADGLFAAIVRELAYTNVTTTDRYLPGLVAVIDGTDPAMALAEVEASVIDLVDRPS